MSEDHFPFADRDIDGPIVSVQKAQAPDAVTGHLAFGVLTKPLLVCVPGPIGWLDVVQENRIEILIADVGLGRPGVVERIQPLCIDVSEPAEAEQPELAVIRLTRPSSQEPSGRSVDRARIDRLRRSETGPVRASMLESLGAIPRGLQDLSCEEVLQPIDEWELHQRRCLVRRAPRMVPRICWCCFLGCG